MSIVDGVGYLASVLVLLTFCMGTMVRLRTIAVCSNVAFVTYGLSAQVYPVVALHVILLPLNLVLLARMVSVLREAKLAAATDLSPAWLEPFMHTKRLNAGEVLFHKGDHADSLYVIASGVIELPEIDHQLSSGELFGEIGLFTLNRRRTQTAVAKTDVRLMWMSANEVKRLCERNPGLALYFLRLTATRLTANVDRAEKAYEQGSMNGVGQLS